jgi:hypothetical protein
MGRQVIFPGPGDQHPPPSQFRLVAFDSKTQPEDESTGYLRLAQLMRNQVFIGELKMLLGRESKAASGRRSEIKEVDDHEGVSRHILGICEFGDISTSYAILVLLVIFFMLTSFASLRLIFRCRR